MSKADNHSSTLTRRAVLARTPAVVAAAGAFGLPTISSASHAEPLVALWREYFPIEAAIKALVKQRDAISASLPEGVRMPRVQIGTYYQAGSAAPGEAPRSEPSTCTATVRSTN